MRRAPVEDIPVDTLARKADLSTVAFFAAFKRATGLPPYAFLLAVRVKAAAKDLENPELFVKAVGAFHDRFLILDDRELYHFGASLKDLGRQYCAVTKMDAVFIPSVLERI